MAATKYVKPPKSITVKGIRAGKSFSIPTLSGGATGVHYNSVFTGTTNFGMFGRSDIFASLIHDNLGSGETVKQSTPTSTSGNGGYAWLNADAASVTAAPGEDTQTQDTVSVTCVPLQGCNKMSFSFIVYDTTGVANTAVLHLLRPYNANDANTFFGIAGGIESYIRVATWGPASSAGLWDGQSLIFGGNAFPVSPTFLTFSPIEIPSGVFFLHLQMANNTACALMGDIFFHG